MVSKNQRKADAKRQRVMWEINPVTRHKGNDKAYTRKRKHKGKEF